MKFEILLPTKNNLMWSIYGIVIPPHWSEIQLDNLLFVVCFNLKKLKRQIIVFSML
jgi:hypothetical protein